MLEEEKNSEKDRLTVKAPLTVGQEKRERGVKIDANREEALSDGFRLC
jgi:hypothetical protein